ncbi:hypothetical protein [Carboxylicivirga taeanensis]|uniref:hypothetical protein n=1 Tax=Carboxylicivirga taeanensis TaxID=1416875 RepID=UPI003F6DB512
MPTHLVAHLHFSLPANQPEKCKRATNPSHRELAKQDKKIKKGECITMYIKHLADSTNLKAITLNENCSGLTGLLSEMPNVSYT